MRPIGNQTQLESRRVTALDLLEAGVPAPEAARRVGATVRSVYRWRTQYRKEGLEGVKARPLSQRARRMDRVQLEKLRLILEEGPSQAGYWALAWTAPMIASVILKEFGISYHPSHVGRLLRGIGWRPTTPLKSAARVSPEELKRRVIMGLIRNNKINA